MKLRTPKKPAKPKIEGFGDRPKVTCKSCKYLSDEENMHHICPKTGMVTHINTEKICIYHEQQSVNTGQAADGK